MADAASEEMMSPPPGSRNTLPKYVEHMRAVDAVGKLNEVRIAIAF